MPKTQKADKAKASKTAETFVAPEEHRPLLSEVSGFIASLGRRDAAEALELGRQLIRVKSVLPEKSFGKWLKLECGMTVRNAWNHTIRVEVFTVEQQELLIAAAVKPTVMTTIATAEAPVITELLSRILSGEQFTVSKVKQRIKGDTPATTATESGGATGLRRAGEARMKVDLEVFTKLVKGSLKAVELIVADIRKGKHVAKTKLATAVEADCQKAGILLSAVISPRGSDAPLPVEWEKARRIIARLGDSQRYPGREEFHDWVVDEALPALRFVVLGEAFPGTAGVIAHAEVSIPDEGENDAAEQHANPDATAVANEPLSEESDSGAGDHAKEAPARTRLAKVPSLAPVEMSSPEPEIQTEGAVND
jgi:hypothetical protein